MNRMRKVLIADDEIKVGQLVKRLIQWDRLGLTCIGLVTDGQTAVCGVGRLELEIQRKKDGAVIRFANAGVDGSFCLGELKEKERGHGWRR